MLRVLKSELIRLKRPSFLLGGLGFMALIGVLATFISFSATGVEGTAGPAALFPSEAALAAGDGYVASLALASQLLGIVALSLWAIAVASDYQTGLIRLLAQAEPSRMRLLIGKLLALMLFTLLGVAIAMLMAVGTAFLLAPSFSISTSAWGGEALTTVLEAYRNLALSTAVWGLIGFTIATITRSAGASIGLGIGWVVVFETMLVGTAPDIADWMPGSMLSALAGGGTPNIEFETALWLAVAYTAAAIIITGVITKRREITF